MITVIWQDPTILTKDILFSSRAVEKCKVRHVTFVSDCWKQLKHVYIISQVGCWLDHRQDDEKYWVKLIFKIKKIVEDKLIRNHIQSNFVVCTAMGECSDIAPCCQSLLHIWLCLVAGCGLASAMWLSVGCYCSSPGRLGLFGSRDFGRSPNQATD